MGTDSLLSARMGRVRPSPTIAVSTLAKELKASGKDVINLGTGEPDFDTPEHIKEAARRALADGETKYTAVPGTQELREAICRKLVRDNGLSYSPDQIVVTCGAKHALMNLCQAVVDHNDEVVIPAPCWVSYPDITTFCGGKPVIIHAPSEARYKITPDQLEDALDEKRTRLLMLNSPCNPSGAVYSKEEMRMLGEVLERYPNVLICSDEIYEHIVYNSSSACSFGSACPELKDRTIIVNGVSKAYAMTGWRIGFSASPPKIAKAMATIQSQTTSNVCSIAQAAAIAAFDSNLDVLKPMLEAFDARRARVVHALTAIDGIELPSIGGAFYAFPYAQKAIEDLYERNKISAPNDNTFCTWLLDGAGVAAVPGFAFEAAGSFRISFAAEDSLIDKALARIAEALAH